MHALTTEAREGHVELRERVRRRVRRRESEDKNSLYETDNEKEGNKQE